MTFLLLSMLIILVTEEHQCKPVACTFTDLVIAYSTCNPTTLPHDILAVFNWMIKKNSTKYVDTKANSHTKSVKTHTFFSIHLSTIKTELYADPCMVSLQNPSEQHKFSVGVIFT